MASDFVPFLSAIRGKTGHGSSNVVSGAAGASTTPFAPMTSASVSAAAPASLSTGHPAPHSHTHSGGGTLVELKRTGDKVTQIRIQCRCGEIIDLDCEY